MVKDRTFEDLKSILKENKRQLQKRYSIKSIGIFGSRARGENCGDSDLDILVEFEEEKELGLIGFIEIENYLSDLFGIKVDLVEKSALKPRIGSVIMREVVYA